MSAVSAVLVRTFKVGKRACTLTLPQPVAGRALAMVAELSPTVPDSLSPTEWTEYRAGRDAAIEDLARIIGERIAVIDL